MPENGLVQRPETVTFAVEDMSCGSCVRHIDEALKENVQLLDHHIDLPARRLTVTFQPAITSELVIARVMEEAGYSVKVV